jgi:hypothetical protein
MDAEGFPAMPPLSSLRRVSQIEILSHKRNHDEAQHRVQYLIETNPV